MATAAAKTQAAVARPQPLSRTPGGVAVCAGGLHDAAGCPSSSVEGLFRTPSPGSKRELPKPEWSVHVPRRLQELRGVLARAGEELAAQGVHEPTVADLARHLDLSEDEVIDGLVACNGYDSDSIDRPIATGGGTDRRSPERPCRGPGRRRHAPDPSRR
ncbi:sigma-70 domain-containing protein [Streptomyces decoyicus]